MLVPSCLGGFIFGIMPGMGRIKFMPPSWVIPYVAITAIAAATVSVELTKAIGGTANSIFIVSVVTVIFSIIYRHQLTRIFGHHSGHSESK